MNGEAAGTIRLVELKDKTKLTRLAVLKEYSEYCGVCEAVN